MAIGLPQLMTRRWIERPLNAAMATVLSSPLHVIVSSRLLLMLIPGRRTGRIYRVPAGYAQHGDELFIGTGLTQWRRNLQAAPEITVVLRGQSRRRTESWDALLEAHGERIQEVFSAAPDPRRALEAADLIAKVLSGLRPNYREILILREVEGLSYEEIGQVLECSIDSVKAQLRRGREELEEKLRHFIGRPGV